MCKTYSKQKFCTICGCSYLSKHRERKKCYDCGPLRKDRLPNGVAPATEKRCPKCLEFKPLKKFHKCRKSRHGVVSECKQCRKRYRDCKEFTLTCSSIGCDNWFVSNRNRPRKCPDCSTVRVKSSDALCRYTAPFYENMKEFQRNHSGLYQHAESSGILEEIRKHMLPMDCTFTRTGFASRCEKNKGFGIFYLLKCYDIDESFYKFGITSHDVDKRYHYEMDYEYDTLLSIEAPAGFVWDLERNIRKLTRDINYTPRIPFGGHLTECFKCNSNNSILREILAVESYLQSA